MSDNRIYDVRNLTYTGLVEQYVAHSKIKNLTIIQDVIQPEFENVVRLKFYQCEIENLHIIIDCYAHNIEKIKQKDMFDLDSKRKTLRYVRDAFPILHTNFDGCKINSLTYEIKYCNKIPWHVTTIELHNYLRCEIDNINFIGSFDDCLSREYLKTTDQLEKEYKELLIQAELGQRVEATNRMPNGKHMLCGKIATVKECKINNFKIPYIDPNINFLENASNTQLLHLVIDASAEYNRGCIEKIARFIIRAISTHRYKIDVINLTEQEYIQILKVICLWKTDLLKLETWHRGYKEDKFDDYMSKLANLDRFVVGPTKPLSNLLDRLLPTTNIRALVKFKFNGDVIDTEKLRKCMIEESNFIYNKFRVANLIGLETFTNEEKEADHVLELYMHGLPLITNDV